MPTTEEPFGTLLRRYRRAAALSQEDLARRAGLSVAAISYLERGVRTMPRPETLQALASTLGLSPEQRATFIAAVHQDVTPAAEPAVGAPVPAAWAPAPLPVPPTPLLGREREEAGLMHLALRRAVRLLTLTGPGGVGKTRLALRVAEELAPSFRDGVCWVPLAALSEPRLLGATLLHALGGSELAQHAAETQLLQRLRPRAVLLVLDNYEHLLPDVALVTALLSACPALAILVTSRAPLRVRGEQEYALAPLPVPHEGLPLSAASLLQYPAAGLFVQRVHAVNPAFVLTDALAPRVAALCRRLDGLPLALELVAAQVKVWGVEALAGRLDNRLALLVDGARDLPPRQQTLRATIAWSEDLLDAPARRLFRRLGVFAGGCTLASVQAVCAEDGADDVLPALRTLVDQSLLQHVDAEEAADPRFALLETIREYARAQLAAQDELALLRDRHLRWCLDLATQAVAALAGPDQTAWLRRLEREHDNLRAALAWARERGAVEEGLRLASALRRFWFTRGYFHEGRLWLEAALVGSEGCAPAIRARALTAAGTLASHQGDHERAVVWHEEALAAYRQLGDQPGIAVALGSLGWATQLQGDAARAARLLTEALADYRALGDPDGVANMLNDLGWVMQVQGDYARAAALHEEALAGFRALGDRLGIASVLVNLGWVAQAQGDDRRAAAVLEESLLLGREIGARELQAEVLEAVAWMAAAAGHAAWAARLGGAAEAQREALGMSLPPTLQTGHEHAVRAMRDAMGEQLFATVWAEGHTLPLDDAVALVLDDAEACGRGLQP